MALATGITLTTQPAASEPLQALMCFKKLALRSHVKDSPSGSHPQLGLFVLEILEGKFADRLNIGGHACQ